MARRPWTRSGAALPTPTARSELLLLLLLYVGYSITRVLVDAQPATGRANGERLLAAERLVGLDVEAAAVDWLVRSTTWSVAVSYAYALLHYTVTPLTLLWLYRTHPLQYRRLRAVLVSATCVALVCYWIVPTAPPRLLGDAYPDVLALTSDYGWWGTEASAPRGLGSLTNQYAAMPSMHVGWAAWCGLAVLCATRNRGLRVLAVTYPLLMAVVVVATGNHYVLDALAGAALVGLLLLTPGRTAVARALAPLPRPALLTAFGRAP